MRLPLGGRSLQNDLACPLHLLHVVCRLIDGASRHVVIHTWAATRVWRVRWIPH